jgi:hypothetical protein
LTAVKKAAHCIDRGLRSQRWTSRAGGSPNRFKRLITFLRRRCDRTLPSSWFFHRADVRSACAQHDLVAAAGDLECVDLAALFEPPTKRVDHFLAAAKKSIMTVSRFSWPMPGITPP